MDGSKENKATSLAQFIQLAETVKNFIENLISGTNSSIASVENMVNKISDKSTGTVYHLSVEDGKFYLDDGRG